MKYIIKNYFIFFITVLLFTSFTSLILTILDISNILNYDLGLIISYIISYVFFAILSFICGLKLKSKGLVHGIMLSFFIFLLSFFIGNEISWIILLTRSIIIVFFTILGVNKKASL